MVWWRDEGRRACSEESDDEGDNWKKEERETEDKMGGCVQKRCMQTVGPRAGEEGDGAYWRARINNDTGDPGWRDKPETKKKKSWLKPDREYSKLPLCPTTTISATYNPDKSTPNPNSSHIYHPINVSEWDLHESHPKLPDAYADNYNYCNAVLNKYCWNWIKHLSEICLELIFLRENRQNHKFTLFHRLPGHNLFLYRSTSSTIMLLSTFTLERRFFAATWVDFWDLNYVILLLKNKFITALTKPQLLFLLTSPSIFYFNQYSCRGAILQLIIPFLFYFSATHSTYGIS